MVWYAWAVVALLVIGSFLNILSIGKPRRPTTPGVAAGAVALNALVVWAVISLASS